MATMERVGLDIYRADRAAWITTDVLKAKRLLRKLPGKPLGWVTTPLDPAHTIWRVAYVVRVGEANLAFADGTVDFSTGKPVVSVRRHETPRSLDAGEVTLLAARNDALSREWMACGKDPYNTVVLAEGVGSSVYLMPPQHSTKEFPMGGFHRFRYDESGKLLEQYAQTRSCAVQSEAGLPRGATLEGLMISHITSATPTELHVFMNLAYGKPVFVATSDRKLWQVEGGRIRIEANLDEPAAQ